MNKWITFLKGVAITAVVLLHVLSSIKSGIFTVHPDRALFIALDQTLRFCVPLFVALSGYALSKKYQQQPMQVKSFYLRRLQKLLPLYLVWSAVFLVLFTLIPGWSIAGESPAVLKLLVLGRADYHLYFVAMIFQLYALFPLIHWGVSRPVTRHWTVVGLLLLQAGYLILIHVAMKQAEISSVRPWLASDQHQYQMAFSWIGYFGLGIWLSYVEQRIPYRQWLKLLATVMLVVGWVWVVRAAISGIAAGGDPLYELRFTRFPVLLYAASFTYIVIVHQKVMRFIPALLQRSLLVIGKHSYLLYLCHTLFLRILFSRDLIAMGKVSWVEVATATAVGIITVGISLKLLKE